MAGRVPVPLTCLPSTCLPSNCLPSRCCYCGRVRGPSLQQRSRAVGFNYHFCSKPCPQGQKLWGKFATIIVLNLTVITAQILVPNSFVDGILIHVITKSEDQLHHKFELSVFSSTRRLPLEFVLTPRGSLCEHVIGSCRGEPIGTTRNSFRARFTQ